MKFSHSVVLAFIANALAQTGSIEGDVAAIPACAKKCLDDAILGAGCASISDFACQCGSAKGTITATAGPCVAKACAASDLTKVLALTTEICALVEAGGGADGSATGGSETTMATATSGGSETGAPTETGTGGAGSETTAAPTGTETGGAGSETTAAPTGTETGGSGSETGTPTGGAGGEETTSEAPNTTPTSGAMATAAVWNYGIVAAGAGVVAAGFM